MSNFNTIDLEKEKATIEQEHKGHTLTFFINEEKFHSHEQYITGRKIRELGEIPQDWIILLAIERPWEDEVIANDSRVDLARDGKEHFISHAPDHKVEITIDNDPFKVKRGPHSVSQLKAIGHVPGEYELEELVDGVLQPLKDDPCAKYSPRSCTHYPLTAIGPPIYTKL